MIDIVKEISLSLAIFGTIIFLADCTLGFICKKYDCLEDAREPLLVVIAILCSLAIIVFYNLGGSATIVVTYVILTAVTRGINKGTEEITALLKEQSGRRQKL